eukprot:4907107-Pyramimonas_sp.AAC.1
MCIRDSASGGARGAAGGAQARIQEICAERQHFMFMRFFFFDTLTPTVKTLGKEAFGKASRVSGIRSGLSPYNGILGEK